MVATAQTPTDGATTFPEAGTWALDPGHSRVGFEGRHLMVSRIRGAFTDFTGALHLGATPEESTAALTIRAASIESGFADRDNHLRSADFFDVGRYPEIAVRVHSLRHTAAGTWTASADLTVREITRPVEIAIEFYGAVNDPWGNRKLGFTATAEINREEWGLTWNAVMEGGGLVAGKKVRIEVDGEAIRQ